MTRLWGLWLLTLCLVFVLRATAQPPDTDGIENRSGLPFSSVTGSGTTDFVPIWTSTTALGNSLLYQTGGNVGIGTTSPAWALDVVGHINASKSYKILGKTVLAIPGGSANSNIAVGYQALSAVTTGIENAACGASALASNTAGPYNTAIGYAALFSNVSGGNNTAVCANALEKNTSSYNTATGALALFSTTTGSSNTAAGYSALYGNTTGSNNVAFGQNALMNNTSGSSNIAVGFDAGINLSGNSSNNIDIANQGSSSDSGTIRIGTSGTQTSFYAAGVYGVTTGMNNAVPVLIDSNGQLGTVSSSRRYKTDIHDMGDASRDLLRLRPVTFRYQKLFADGSQPLQYGLIAEEVAEVFPDLVAHSADGQIETVKYQSLDPLLLNEVERQQAEIRSLRERVNQLKAAVEAIISSQK
jgi:hypothetical protein